ncbi:MAG: PrsW family intramembrane metalloprotease [Candidatus Micrarchaeia archaeon]
MRGAGTWFAVFLLALFPAAFAAIPTAFTPEQVSGRPLDANITDTKEEILFNESRSTVSITALVKNPGNEPLAVYFAVREPARWVVYKSLGEVPPASARSFAFEVEFDYWNENVRTMRYALVGVEAGGNVSGYEFSLEEKWQAYLEKNVRDVLVRAYVLVVPIVAILLAFLLFAVVDVAYRRRDEGELIPGEYTLRTLVFPVVRGRPLKEALADVLLNPLFWALEFAGGLVLVSLIFSQSMSLLGADVGLRVFVISGMSALVMPLLYIVAAWIADYYEREPLRFVASAFMWGVLAAFLSFIINTVGTGFVEALFGEARVGGDVGAVLLGTALLAPVVEEVLKGAGVVVLAGHHEMDDALDGLLYGFAAGVGFSFIENWFYFALEANPFQWGIRAWIALILYRSFFNSLAHGSFTSAAGVVMGYMKSRPELVRYAQLGFVPGVFIAILLHIFFNIGAILDTIAIFRWQVPVFIFNPILVLALGIVFLIVFALATLDTKRRVEARGVVA